MVAPSSTETKIFRFKLYKENDYRLTLKPHPIKQTESRPPLLKMTMSCSAPPTPLRYKGERSRNGDLRCIKIQRVFQKETGWRWRRRKGRLGSFPFFPSPSRTTKHRSSNIATDGRRIWSKSGARAHGALSVSQTRAPLLRPQSLREQLGAHKAEFACNFVKRVVHAYHWGNADASERDKSGGRYDTERCAWSSKVTSHEPGQEKMSFAILSFLRGALNARSPSQLKFQPQSRPKVVTKLVRMGLNDARALNTPRLPFFDRISC